jgi:two-component system sensor histidine kinase FlrB
LNLATNAIQACGTGVELHLIAVSDGDGVVYLQLSDNGPGIAAEIRDRIFEPFFTTKSSGTGLGLAVVRAVAEGHHGEIWLDTQPGSGCTFTLRIPVIKEDRGIT